MTPLEALALKRIRELETYAQEQYGVTLTCGAEQEAYVRNAQGGRGSENVRQTMLHDDSPLPWVSTIKTEHGQGQIEYLVQPRGAAACKWMPSPGGFDPATAKPSLVAPQIALARKQMQAYTASLSPSARLAYWACNPDSRIDTGALHINIGIYGPDGWRRDIDGLHKQTLPALEALFPLIVTSPDSLTRFERAVTGNTYCVPESFSTIENKGVVDKRLYRLEFRLPGADANPYFATLMAVAATVDALERERTGQPLPEEDHPIPHQRLAYAKSLAQFGQSTHVAALIGPEFQQAYLAHARQSRASQLSMA